MWWRATCAFSPKTNCPITNFYWAFLDRNEELLAQNPRLRMPYASLRRRARDKKQRDRTVTRWAQERLAAGEILEPDQLRAL